MTITPEPMKMAEKLWDLANIITGFAVAQALATVFAMTKLDMAMLDDKWAHIGAAVGAILYTVLYVAAIVWCGRRGSAADKSNAAIWKWAQIGRLSAVGLFTVIFFITLYGHRDYLKRHPKVPSVTCPS